MQDIRIMLVDDHSIVRAGLRMIIERREGLLVVGEAENAMTALALAAHNQPDVVVLDLNLDGEDALEYIPALQMAAPHSRILVLTATSDVEQHRRAIRLGAVGLVQKAQATGVLIQALERVAAGETWLDPSLVANVLQHMSRTQHTANVDAETAKYMTLTPREQEVIALICEGLPNRTIGQRLSITETTVRHHLTSVFAKLGVENRLELVIYAYRHGLARLAP